MTLPVLGITTHFETNSSDVRDSIEESFGRWHALPASYHASTEPTRIRIFVTEGREGVEGRSPISHTSAADKRLVIQSAGSIGYVDPLRHESFAYVTSELVADAEHFRGAVLEAMTFALLCCYDRHPIHAAAITTGARTALLAGPSGAGKSSLAWLAHTEGIGVLGDDHVWVQLDPVCRIWGGTSRVRLLPDSPHAGIVETTTTANGRQKVSIPLADGNARPLLVAEQPVVCILARGERAELTPLSPTEIETELAKQLSPGFDRFPERHPTVWYRLAEGGGWRLTLSPDPRDALPMLHRMLDER